MSEGSGFLNIFELFLGVYMLYGAVTAKGQFYKTDNVKKGMEEKYKKIIRLFCVLLGIPMTIIGAFGTFIKGAMTDMALLELLNKVIFALWILSFIGVIILFVLVFRMTDRTKTSKPGGSGKPAPRAAFEFDEEEINNKPGKPNK